MSWVLWSRRGAQNNPQPKAQCPVVTVSRMVPWQKVDRLSLSCLLQVCHRMNGITQVNACVVINNHQTEGGVYSVA